MGVPTEVGVLHRRAQYSPPTCLHASLLHPRSSSPFLTLSNRCTTGSLHEGRPSACKVAKRRPKSDARASGIKKPSLPDSSILIDRDRLRLAPSNKRPADQPRRESKMLTTVEKPPSSATLHSYPQVRKLPRSQSYEAPTASSSSTTGNTEKCDTLMLRQPETRAITQDQLTNEVECIYAHLVMVGKKSIGIKQQQSQTTSKLSTEKWQALIALHGSLLHGHHSLIFNSQHPSASPALRRLATKYAIPPRMWRHGTHSFLELLRHKLPDSLDHILTFVCLPYSMMAVLIQSVPCFLETWIECLGDLARYRMAIEEADLRDREIRAGVARMWYKKAADRSPTVGRIQHHLAVLARPNIVQQLYYYSKALMKIIPFLDAREGVILSFTSQKHSSLEVSLLDTPMDTPMDRRAQMRDFLALSNRITLHKSRTTPCPAQGPSTKDALSSEEYDPVTYPCQVLGNGTNVVCQHIGDKNILPYMHVSLGFLLSLTYVPSALQYVEGHAPWGRIVTLPNTLGRSGVVDSSLSGTGRQLPENFVMRALVWSLYYLPENFFERQVVDEDERTLELASHAARLTEHGLSTRVHLFAILRDQSGSFLECVWQEAMTYLDGISAPIVAAFQRCISISQKITLPIVMAHLIQGATAQSNETATENNIRDYWDELAYSILSALKIWSLPTTISVGVLATVGWRSSVHRVTRSRAIIVSRRAAGVSAMATLIVADSRSTAEWVYPTVFTALSLQLMHQRALFSDRDPHYVELAAAAAVGVILDGVVCHLASGGSGLFLQSLALECWLTLTAFWYFHPVPNGPARISVGLLPGP